MEELWQWFSVFAATFMAMIAIIDPFALIPIYLSLTDNFNAKDRLTVCRKSIWIATAILLLFAFSGTTIFKLFGISIPAFRIAGGILLLLLGIAQLSAERERVKSEEESESKIRDDISIFPLATPLLAGPGAISTAVLHSGNGLLSNLALYAAILAAMITSYFALRAAPILFKLLGRTGLNLLTRIMGVILTAIAVQFIIDGITSVIQEIMTLP
ncbi:MAG: MarC family protein [Oligoflexus sp.]